MEEDMNDASNISSDLLHRKNKNKCIIKNLKINPDEGFSMIEAYPFSSDSLKDELSPEWYDIIPNSI